MTRNPDTFSSTCRAAAPEAAPAGRPMAGNGREGTGMPFSADRQAEANPMEDRWNFRLLV